MEMDKEVNTDLSYIRDDMDKGEVLNLQLTRDEAESLVWFVEEVGVADDTPLRTALDSLKAQLRQ